jgi:hypothetical protein
MRPRTIGNSRFLRRWSAFSQSKDHHPDRVVRVDALVGERVQPGGGAHGDLLQDGGLPEAAGAGQHEPVTLAEEPGDHRRWRVGGAVHERLVVDRQDRRAGPLVAGAGQLLPGELEELRRFGARRLGLLRDALPRDGDAAHDGERRRWPRRGR